MTAGNERREPSGRVAIAPAPSAEELVAILVALRQRHGRRQTEQPAHRPSAWVRAARREAMRGRSAPQRWAQ